MNNFNINIIIVCFNDGDNLQITLESIRRYKKQYHRLYIIDGNSIDKTSELISLNNDIIDDYIIEKDHGIYNAMNKSLLFHQIDDNDFLYWLNAGDELQDWDDNFVLCLNDVDCCFAGILSKKKFSSLNSKKIFPRIIKPYNEKNFFPKSLYMHQGFLIRKRIYKKYLYNEDIGLQAENLLMSNCILNHKLICTDYILATYYTNGVSNNKHFEVYISFLKVLKKLGMSRTMHLLYHPLFHFKYIIKILLSIIK